MFWYNNCVQFFLLWFLLLFSVHGVFFVTTSSANWVFPICGEQKKSEGKLLKNDTKFACSLAVIRFASKWINTFSIEPSSLNGYRILGGRKQSAPDTHGIDEWRKATSDSYAHISLFRVMLIFVLFFFSFCPVRVVAVLLTNTIRCHSIHFNDVAGVHSIECDSLSMTRQHTTGRSGWVVCASNHPFSHSHAIRCQNDGNGILVFTNHNSERMNFEGWKPMRIVALVNVRFTVPRVRWGRSVLLCQSNANVNDNNQTGAHFWISQRLQVTNWYLAGLSNRQRLSPLIHEH